MTGEIATRGQPAPIQADRRWVIERTHGWGNQHGKLRWCTERRRVVVEFWLALAAAAIVCGRLVRRAWTSYRVDQLTAGTAGHAAGRDHLWRKPERPTAFGKGLTPYVVSRPRLRCPAEPWRRGRCRDRLECVQ
jgi:hypothetical protein